MEWGELFRDWQFTIKNQCIEESIQKQQFKELPFHSDYDFGHYCGWWQKGIADQWPEPKGMTTWRDPLRWIEYQTATVSLWCTARMLWEARLSSEHTAAVWIGATAFDLNHEALHQEQLRGDLISKVLHPAIAQLKKAEIEVWSHSMRHVTPLSFWNLRCFCPQSEFDVVSLAINNCILSHAAYDLVRVFSVLRPKLQRKKKLPSRTPPQTKGVPN